MIIDTHVHWTQNCDAQRQKRILEEAAANGINLLIASDIGDETHYPGKEVIRQANARAKKFAEYAPARIRWQAYLNPQLDNWPDEFEYCAAGGACGVKLWIALKDPGGNLRNTVAVLEKAAAEKLPVLLHVFNRTDANRPGEISIVEFAALAKTVPECVMIAAHAGGNWRQSFGVLNECRANTYMDISGSYPEYRMVEGLVESEGADRLLFGSDANGRSFHSQIAKVTLSSIDEESKEKILWKNAAYVYNISDIPPLPQVKSVRHLELSLPDMTADHFCFCGSWPFFQSQSQTPAELDKLLVAHNISKAYVGDLSGIFNIDLLAANHIFLDKCKGLKKIAPLATLNPAAYNWTCQIKGITVGRFAGGLISPYMHNWKLSDPAFAEFFKLCSQNKIKLWINCAVSDHRFRHRCWNLLPVDTEVLLAFMKNAPDNQYTFQGLSYAAIKEALKQFNNDMRFYFDISKLTDSQFTLEDIINEYSSDHFRSCSGMRISGWSGCGPGAIIPTGSASPKK